jgi:hypothetical protein
MKIAYAGALILLALLALLVGCPPGQSTRVPEVNVAGINPPPASGAPGQAIKNLAALHLTNGEWVMIVAWSRDGAGENIPARVDPASNLLPDRDYYSLTNSMQWQRNGCPPAFRHESKLYIALIVAETGAEKRLSLSDLREIDVKSGETDSQALARYWRQPNAADPPTGGG